MRLPPGIRRLFHLGAIGRDGPAEIDEELRYHVDRVVDELVAEGMEREDAERAARARFGDLDAYRRALEHIDARGPMRGGRGEMLGVLGKNVVTAVRRLRRAPGFTFAVVTILALGIGANAVMFGVVDRLLLHGPDHVVKPDEVRLIYLRRTYLGSGRLETGRTLTYPDYTDLRSVSGFQSVAAYAEDRETFGRGGSAEQVRAVMATASLFPLLGAHPFLGRFYADDDTGPDAELTAVLSYEFWQRRFGGDPSVLGRSVDIGQGRYTVVGVAPEAFTGAELSPVDVWLPLERAGAIENGGTGWRDNRNWWWIQVVARLAPGSTAAAAEAQATAVHQAGRQELVAEGEYSADARLIASPLIAAQGPDPSAESRVARWLAAVSIIVLLIACFNVANLLLARVAARRREVAVRMALGISRGRLLGELLTESFVLAALGAVTALGVARVGGGAIHRTLLPDVTFPHPVGPRLLVFTGLITLVTALLAGVAPALQAARADVAGTLKSEGERAGRVRSGTRTALLVAQAALSVVLLVGAGLFVRSLEHARGLDLGFDPGPVAVVRLEWNETLPGEERAAIYQQALEHVRRLPQVASASLSYTILFQSSISAGRPRVPGVDTIIPPPSGGPYLNKVSSGYFETLGLRVLRGRAFRPGDDAPGAPPVAVITESMADGIWPDGDALGGCMRFGDPSEDPPCTTVVGVVENHRRQDLVEEIPHWLYYVNEHHPSFQGPPQAIMVATRGDPRRALQALRTEVTPVSSEIRFVSAYRLLDNIDPQLRSWTLGASLFSVFGLLALAVAGWGLYSALAFDVALRKRELGIRSALGAGASELIGLVFRQVLGLVAVGIALGLAATLLGGRFVEPLLFHVSARDPEVYGVVVGALLVAGAVAGLIPAWRATRVDPREALQAE